MNPIQSTIVFALMILSSFAFANKSYVDRFWQYQIWQETPPTKINPSFVAFISQNKPLSNQLRQKWLTSLAEKKQWDLYLKYYKEMNHPSLQCHKAWALYQTKPKALTESVIKPLWLVGFSQHKACDRLFAALLKEKKISNTLIEKRLIKALQKRNLSLALYLLKYDTNAPTQDATLLKQIHRYPKLIRTLNNSPLHNAFYLYGLKRLVPKHMPQAIRHFNHAMKKGLLNEQQQQEFLAYLALYKAMRNHDDAYLWFKKVNPKNRQAVLLDWQIRYALRNQQWQRVLTLINAVPDKKNPSIQYWKARAQEHLGQKQKAQKTYNKLANMRHYYGFLASKRLKKSLAFEKEQTHIRSILPKEYQPVLTQIKQLYDKKDYYHASIMINDFSSELPKNERVALAVWVSKALDWHGKSVYLANRSKDLQNYLDLRFPIAYETTIDKRLSHSPLPKAFIYAIIRQESAFRSRVISQAGARGLMQLLPKTAKMIARKDNIVYRNTNDLFDSITNIHLGIAYLTHLYKQFNNHPALIAASYNAGPRQVKKWLKENKTNDTELWIETIPFHETRNYLKNIIAFYAVYQHQLNQPVQLNYLLQPIHNQHITSP